MSVDLARDLYLLLAVLGLALSVGYAGLPVLGQGAFVATGSFGTALLGPGGAGWPLGVAALAAVAIAAVAGYLVGVAAAGLQGAELALATWALAWLVAAVLVAFPGLSGGAQGLVRTAPAHLVSPVLGLDLTLGPWVHVGIAALACALTVLVLARLERGPGGLDLAALRESSELAASLGVPVGRRRRSVLAVSAGLGGLAGAGVLAVTGVVAAADVSPLLSVQLLVAALAVPLARWWAPLLGAALVGGGLSLATRVAEAAGADSQRVRGVVTAAVFIAVLALRGRWRARPGELRFDPAARLPAPERAATAEPAVEARGVSVRFGGVQALDGVDLSLRAGRVHALVGPNGSGKSTLLKVLAGEVDAQQGTLRRAGRPVPASRAARVRAGIARTPQHTVLVPGLRVAAQVAVGARVATAVPGSALRHLLATPRSRTEQAARDGRVVEALELTGLRDRAQADPVNLAAGDQRLLQIARAAATGARVLLLDEPAAGMTRDERERLAQVLAALAGNGVAVLLVEHDMALVGRSADWVTVLDAGRVVAAGPPARVTADPAVQRAYLGAPVEDRP